MIDITLTQAAEDAVAQRGWVVPARRPRILGNRGVAVLEVHVPDALAEAPERLQRVAAAVREVAGVQAEADKVSGRHLHQPSRLLGRLDERAAVVVEDGTQAGLLLARLSLCVQSLRRRLASLLR